MRVGFVVPKLSGGGAEYVAREWATHLAVGDSEVYVFSTQAVETSSMNDFRVIKLPGSSFFEHLRNLRAALATYEVDVLIGVMPYWNLLAILAGKLQLAHRPKTVVSSHTIESKYGADRGRGFIRQTRLARFLYRYADAFIASSHPVAAEAVAKYQVERDRLWVVPNPVFPATVERVHTATVAVESELGIPDVIVVPGRLVDQKRPNLAIDVAAAISAMGEASPQVWFVGDGPASSSLQVKADCAGVECKFVAWETQWPALLPRTAVVLLPSMLEGFGNVLLDAAASGFPVVVSSKALGVADAVIPGITGVLVPGDAIKDYVDGVLSARELSGRVGNQTTVQWLNRFTRENSGNQLESIISSLRPGISK